MLEAAHIVPVGHRGSNDPRNGLPLNAALHRAFDAFLFTIHPETHEVVTKPTGPKPSDLGITTLSLSHLHKLPHPDALWWRFHEWQKRTT